MRLPFFYGWVIVAVTFACFAVGYTTHNSFSIFYVAILEEFGWSRGATAVTFSIFTLMYGFNSPVAGALVDRFGPRRVLPVAGLLLGAALLMTTQLSTLWQFYLLFGVVAGIGLSGMGTVPTMTVLNNWFVKKRGLAAGLGTAGIGVGIFFFIPPLQMIITAHGWRTAYLVLAAGTILVIPTLAILFQRYRPQEMGLHPDGDSSGASPSQTRAELVQADDLVVDKAWASREWTLRSSARTARYWMLFAGRFLELMCMQLFATHQAAYLVDAGFEKQLVASVIGVLGIVSSFGKVIWGFTSDRIGREVTYILAYGAGSAGALILLSIHAGSPSWMLYTYALSYGLCYGCAMVLFPPMVADLFHGRRFGSVLGGLYIGGGFGQAFGAFLGGYVFDLTGSYFWAYALTIPAWCVSFILYWVAAPRKVRLVAGKARKVAGLQVDA